MVYRMKFNLIIYINIPAICKKLHLKKTTLEILDYKYISNTQACVVQNSEIGIHYPHYQYV